MLWSDNKRDDREAQTEDNRINEIENQSDNVKKAYSDVQSLNDRLDALKKKSAAIQKQAESQKQETAKMEREIEARKQKSLEEIQRKKAEERAKAEENARQAAREEAAKKKAEAHQRALERKQRELDADRRAVEEDHIRLKNQIALQARINRKKAEDARKKAEEEQKVASQQRAEEFEIDKEQRKKEEQLRILEEANRKQVAGEKRAQKKAEERQKRAERQKLIEEQRALQRSLRERNIEEARRLRHELDERKREERIERANIRRQKKLARKSAELGGGIVQVHGTEISTEIRPVGGYSLRDLLGLVSRKDKKNAASEEELQALIRESEIKREEARQVAARLQELRRENFRNSRLGMRMAKITAFSEKHKRPLLIGFSVLLVLGVGTAGIINHMTAFEYSYNGKTLGYVKNKEDVTKVTELVQDALSQDADMSVVIDPRSDISFSRVTNLNGDLTIDSSEQVLKRLTYMGDFNVKAYGIYIDGKKVGAVSDKETAAQVLQDIKDKYVSGKSGSVVEEAVIMEDIEIKKSNTKLQNVSSEEAMVEKLCTSGKREIVHQVVAGETLADIATSYNTTEDAIEEDNPGIDPKKLEVGSSLLIKQNAPVLTVRITEKRTYTKKIKYETEEQDDDTMYEGDTEVKQKGVNGESEVTDRTILVNGEVSSTEVLSEDVKSEPTTKIVLVGTKERPPTVGSGTYIWPTNGTFRISSGFGPRWGRTHEGIDMACTTGTDVLASDGGTVTKAGYHGSYGMLVVVDHQNGVETYYAHNSKLLVKVGDKVYQGQHIAESGSTGRSTGPHIHFGVKVNGVFKNPMNYLPDRD